MTGQETPMLELKKGTSLQIIQVLNIWYYKQIYSNNLGNLDEKGKVLENYISPKMTQKKLKVWKSEVGSY